MSWHDRLLEEARQDLRQVEREMQSKMRLLDLHLRQLREDLPTCCPHHVWPCCLHQPDACPWERRAITARMDVERELKSIQRRLNKMVHSFHDHRLLALVDMKGFDPKEVSVTVKDRKVKVVAEHEEEFSTSRGKEYNYRNISQEITLPSGVSEDEVTYSLCPNNVLKIEAVRCCPCLPSTTPAGSNTQTQSLLCHISPSALGLFP
ncbi:outer dense fiber protein 1 [Pezoporus occidentalis]|uniref:outer dense fiber protein 1 n=1 Tax=Pezoporus occidentalis TaxID=407982 RepID=UPI002F90F25D